MNKTLATIEHNEGPEYPRVELYLEGGRIMGRCEGEPDHDTEVDARNDTEALARIAETWSDPHWDLRFCQVQP